LKASEIYKNIHNVENKLFDILRLENEKKVEQMILQNSSKHQPNLKKGGKMNIENLLMLNSTCGIKM
jgi:hypothetical protein